MLVILNPTLPENIKDLAKYHEIYFIEGSPHNFDDLERANAKKADKALVMASSKKVNKSDEVMLDSDAIMSVMGIENICEDVYTIAELLYASNIKFLKNPESYKNILGVSTLMNIGEKLIVGEVKIHLKRISEPVINTTCTYHIPPKSNQ